MVDRNIAHALQRVAAETPDAVGLVVVHGHTSKSWTFAEMKGHSEGFAAFLFREGVRRGDRVMLMVKPSMEFVCLTFALFQLGAVVILIDPGMGYKNLLRCIGKVEPNILIGIPRALLFSYLFRRTFASIRSRFSVGPSFFMLAKSVQIEQPEREGNRMPYRAAEEDLAAIIFTTGSTGPPKGVQYTHGIFHAQLGLIRDYYGIGSGDVDQPAFPLFALFATALGAKAVIPDMDPTRPAKVDPVRFIRSIREHKVTYSFGSPAIWNVVSRYCLEQGITLPIQKILMAGAPVSGELVERVRAVMAGGGEIYTPYGATESLPIASISGTEIVTTTWPMTRNGSGTCVGRSLPGMEIRVIQSVEGPLSDWSQATMCRVGEIGEIVVKGPVVTQRYDHDEQETALAKIHDREGFWHRMGDMGYLDAEGRLWFCGRKAHRVITEGSVMYTIPCEAVINEHPKVMRSALVGIGKPGCQKPVIVVECSEKISDPEALIQALQVLARRNPLTRSVTTFMFHPGFPVDIRHNAKIFREKLAAWAEQQLKVPKSI